MPTSRPLWRQAFDFGERLVGRQLEDAARNPAVNTAVALGVRAQKQTQRAVEEIGALTAGLWGYASRRDVRTLVGRVAEVERYLHRLEDRLEDATDGAPAKGEGAKRRTAPRPAASRTGAKGRKANPK